MNFVARRGLTKADYDAARAMHARRFPKYVKFPEHDLLWLLENPDDGIVGYACAAWWPKLKTLALSISALDCWRGFGGQRTLLAAREEEAKKRGAQLVWTHCATDNYKSMVNLIKAGYMMYGWHHNQPFHKFYKRLTDDAPFPHRDKKLARALWRKEITK